MSITPRARLVLAEPPELVIYDEPGPCSYLEGQTWRLPLRLPVRQLSQNEFEQRLEAGDRRQGRLLYRTACPQCRACEPIRVEVDRFQPSRSQRRALRRGKERIRFELGPIEVDEFRVDLYNLHKRDRQLAHRENDASEDEYRAFLGDSCCTSLEMRYFLDGEPLGIAIIDRAAESLSAVYFYYHPKFAAFSPGVFSILQQIGLTRQLGLRYLYLGLYIADCRSMAYKSRFLPHERRIDGQWQRFERAPRLISEAPSH